MPVNESELNLDSTQERMYEFTYAAAIVDAASVGNMAWLRDSIFSAANRYGIDLKETEDSAKTREAYKKAFQEDLVARGILERSNTVGGYVLSKNEQKRKEFGTLMFNVRCTQDELKIAKSTVGLVKRALKLKTGTLSYLAKELQLGPKIVSTIAVHLLAVIATVQALDKSQEDLLSMVRSHIARDILHMDDQEVVRSIFSNEASEKGLIGDEKTKNGPEEVLGEFKFGTKVWEQAVKKAQKYVSEFAKVNGPTVMEAHFSGKQKDEALARAERRFEGKNRKQSVAKQCANFMQDISFFQADAMMGAYLEIEKEVDPDRRATFSMEKAGIGVRSVDTRAKYLIPHLISFACVVNELSKDMTIGNTSKLMLSISAFFHKGYNSKSVNVQALSRFANQFVYGIDCVASFLAKRIIPVGEFTQAEYDIRHFNIKEVDERKRGENYAKTYAALNVYRAGKAEYIVGAFDVFKMRPKDCLWAMAYLTAGINATKNGVVYDLPKNEKIDGKKEITEKHDKDLDKKALALYEKYEKIADEIGYEASLREMKDEFITLHHDAIDKSEKMRERAGLQPLCEISHFNKIYDNAPLKEFDYIHVKSMTKEEYQNTDINEIYEKNDAIYIKDGYTGALQVLGEKRIITATLDECNRAVSMDLTSEAVNSLTEERNGENTKRYTLSLIDNAQNHLLINDVLKVYGNTFDSQGAGSKAVEKWMGVVTDLIATDKYVSFVDKATGKCGMKDVRTGVEFEFSNCDPSVGISDQCMTLKRFAVNVLKVERENLCKQCGISERELQCVSEVMDCMSPAKRNILSRIDERHCVSSIHKNLLLLNGGMSVKDTLINVDKRCNLVDNLMGFVKDFDKIQLITNELDMEMRNYIELNKTDPILALCKTINPKCERDGKYITLSLDDGKRFSINQTNGKLADFCNELDDQINDLQNVFKQALIDARNSGIDLSYTTGEEWDRISDDDKNATRDEDLMER